jgi:hypothetical protein
VDHADSAQNVVEAAAMVLRARNRVEAGTVTDRIADPTEGQEAPEERVDTPAPATPVEPEGWGDSLENVADLAKKYGFTRDNILVFICACFILRVVYRMVQSRLITKHAFRRIVSAWDVLEGAGWLVTLCAAFLNLKDSRIFRFQKVASAVVRLARLDEKAINPLINPGVGFTGDGIVQRAREHSFVIAGALALIALSIVLWYMRPGEKESGTLVAHAKDSADKAVGPDHVAVAETATSTDQELDARAGEDKVKHKKKPSTKWYKARENWDEYETEEQYRERIEDLEQYVAELKDEELDDEERPSDKKTYKNQQAKKGKKKGKNKPPVLHNNAGAFTSVKTDKHSSIPLKAGKDVVGFCGRVNVDGRDLVVSLGHVTQYKPTFEGQKESSWKNLTDGEDPLTVVEGEGTSLRKLGEAVPVEKGRACMFVCDGAVQYGMIVDVGKDWFKHTCFTQKGYSGAVIFMADQENNWRPVGLNQGLYLAPGTPNAGVPFLFRA